MNYLDFRDKPRSGYGWIYKYTSPSGKSYIGQTTYSLYERARKNGIGYQRCTVFYNAIKKYGLENFTVEILDEVLEQELEEKEGYYINLYKTIQPYGYNYYSQGCGPRSSKASTSIDVYDLQLNFIQSFDSLIDAAQFFQVPYQSISACINHEISHYKDKVYVRKNELPCMPNVKLTHGRKTGQYTLDGQLLNIYNSANEAARAIGKDANAGRNIRLVCSGKRQMAYGYSWKFLD